MLKKRYINLKVGVLRFFSINILEVDIQDVINKLEEFGANKIFEGDLEAEFFDFKDLRLKKDKKMLRLRVKRNHSELTFKERISKDEAKIMKEHETDLDNPESMRTILSSLGLKKIGEMKKHRVSYSLDNVRFEFDTFPNIPTFLEIESDNVSELKLWVENLGFSWSDTKPWTGKDVLDHYSSSL
ncbi:MAG: class IV adenylate cyclase [Candidatus Nanoarchaeia archaeon]